MLPFIFTSFYTAPNLYQDIQYSRAPGCDITLGKDRLPRAMGARAAAPASSTPPKVFSRLTPWSSCVSDTQEFSY